MTLRFGKTASPYLLPAVHDSDVAPELSLEGPSNLLLRHVRINAQGSEVIFAELRGIDLLLTSFQFQFSIRALSGECQ